MFIESTDIFRMHPTLMPAVAMTGAALAALYALYRSLLPKPLPGIPYNKEGAKSIFGDVPNITAVEKAGGRKKTWWAELARKHNSPIAQFFFGLGTKPGIVIADYREARDLVLRRGKELVRGSANREPWEGLIPGHFITMEDDNPHIKSSRFLSRDLMASGFLHSVSAPASYDMVHSLISLWQFKAKHAGGLPFDANEDLNVMAFDIMQAAVFGIPPSDSSTVRHLSKLEAIELPLGDDPKLAEFPKHEKVPGMLNALQMIEETADRVLGLPNVSLFHFFNNNFNLRMTKATREKEAILRYHIDRSAQRLSKDPAGFTPRSAVDYMVSREAEAAAKAGICPSFYSDALRNGLVGYMIGGHDSTHSTLCFMAKRLGANQEIQQKLRQALYAAYPEVYGQGRQPTADDISKAQIPYLDAFIQEVLRADPPSALTTRESAVDMHILGHFIPKGTTIFFAPQGPTFTEKGSAVPEELRSETSAKHGGLGDWADSEFPPDVFEPERWLTAEPEGREPVYDGAAGPFMSFGSGKRGCWGKKLAYLELKLITTLIVWNFQFEPIPADLLDWGVTENLFAKPKSTLVRIKSLWNA